MSFTAINQSTLSMQVVQVVPQVAHESSGVSYVVMSLCDSLIAQGLDIQLASLDAHAMVSMSDVHHTFPLVAVPRRLGWSPAMHRWLQKKAASRQIDLIHNHGLWMMPNVYTGQVAKRCGTLLMVSPHGTLSEWAMQSGSLIKRFFWPLLQRPALDGVNCFHATSESEYKDIRRMGFRQPVAIIPNGIAIHPLAPKMRSRFRTMLFLGRINPVKGLDQLLPAWQRVQDHFPDWRLQIVGPDSRGYLAQLQRLASELQLERVEFSGELLGAEKRRVYREADLFVLPSYSENFGMSVAEALAEGTPAIVTKGAPWKGLTTHGAGWWIDIGVDSLEVCLREALQCSPNNLQEMGLRGRNWMEAEYSWAHVGRLMAQTYRWLAEGQDSATKPDCVMLD